MKGPQSEAQWVAYMQAEFGNGFGQNMRTICQQIIHTHVIALAGVIAIFWGYCVAMWKTGCMAALAIRAELNRQLSMRRAKTKGKKRRLGFFK